MAHWVANVVGLWLFWSDEDNRVAMVREGLLSLLEADCANR